MLVKPKLWLAADDGGYVYNKCKYISMVTRIASSIDIRGNSMGDAFQGIAGTGELPASRVQSG